MTQDEHEHLQTNTKRRIDNTFWSSEVDN